MKNRSSGEHTGPVITASEIGEYEYCSRAWWYRHVIKMPPSGEGAGRMSRGTQAHRRHGSWVKAAGNLGIVGLALAACGILLLAIALYLWLTTG